MKIYEYGISIRLKGNAYQWPAAQNQLLADFNNECKHLIEKDIRRRIDFNIYIHNIIQDTIIADRYWSGELLVNRIKKCIARELSLGELYMEQHMSFIKEVYERMYAGCR